MILLYVNWYCKYGISYLELEEMMKERGIVVDHSTSTGGSSTMPLKSRNACAGSGDDQDSKRSWRMDETYLKVKGKWVYLYRAVNSERIQS